MNTDVDEVEAFLAHYGKKGMRWGVVNEEDTGDNSSKSDDPSFREKRAVKRDAEVKTAQARIDELKTKPFRSKRDERNKKSQIADLEKYRDRQQDDAQRIRDGKLTRKGKQLVIGAAVAGTLLAAYGTYKYVDSGEMHQLMIKGKEFATGQQHSWKKNDFLSQSMDVDGIMKNVVSKVNPDYGKYGTKNNCRRCTFAYEMRRRGFDVKATLSNKGAGQTKFGLANAIDPNSNFPTGTLDSVRTLMKEQSLDESKRPFEMAMNKLSNWGENDIDFKKYIPEIEDNRSAIDKLLDAGNGAPGYLAIPKATAILDALKTNPEGARGELAVGWDMGGGGHSVAWEIIGGKPVVFDNQSGKKYETVEEFAKVAGRIKEAGFTRLDNVELNDNFLKRWLQDA